jgi:flagellar protein FliO/FliZ
MFDTLFGMPLAARFFIAFLVVLALIGVTAWLVRRFGANRLGGGAARGRQPRLAVIDAATVDGRRRLVLIRRDNIEHLLMIGGPTDLVVEPNIVRAAGATREPARGVATEITPRGAPAAENAWPLQPLNEPAPVVPTRSYRSSPTEEPWLAPEPGARPRPVENLSPVPVEPPVRHEAPRLETPRHEPPRAEPRVSPVAAVPSEPPPQNDHNLAEMAQQLEAALRRAPAPDGRPPVTDPLAAQAAAPKPVEPAVRAPLREFKPRVEPKFEPPKLENPEPKAESRFVPKSEQKPEPRFEPRPQVKPEPKAETKPEPSPASEKSLYDNLEEEMASLLGRPSGKT